MSAVERPTDGPDSGWVPGDPVHPEQRPVVRRHCGPCLVAWTAEVKRCPECGELCTEELRKLLDRGRRRRCDCGHAVDDHTDWEGCTWMPCRCELTRTVLAEGATR